MKGAGDDGLVYACLTHVPLTLEFPSWIVPIHLGAAQHDGALNLRDLAGKAARVRDEKDV